MQLSTGAGSLSAANHRVCHPSLHAAEFQPSITISNVSCSISGRILSVQRVLHLHGADASARLIAPVLRPLLMRAQCTTVNAREGRASVLRYRLIGTVSYR